MRYHPAFKYREEDGSGTIDESEKSASAQKAQEQMDINLQLKMNRIETAQPRVDKDKEPKTSRALDELLGVRTNKDMQAKKYREDEYSIQMRERYSPFFRSRL